MLSYRQCMVLHNKKRGVWINTLGCGITKISRYRNRKRIDVFCIETNAKMARQGDSKHSLQTFSRYTTLPELRVFARCKQQRIPATLDQHKKRPEASYPENQREGPLSGSP